LQVVCTTPAAAIPLPPTTTEALWRVTREALTNVERHAHATHAALALECANGVLRLQVTDNGRGVDPQALQRPGHYGVIGMRERVQALGGSLRVVPCPQGGTLVEATVPVEHHHVV
jgi:signal transduction histidine kinase